MPLGGTTKDENYSPLKCAGGCPMVNMALESPRTPPYAPLDRGDFQERVPTCLSRSHKILVALNGHKRGLKPNR